MVEYENDGNLLCHGTVLKEWYSRFATLFQFKIDHIYLLIYFYLSQLNLFILK